MQLLIRYGADIKIVDNDKMSVLDYYNKNNYLKDKEYKESNYMTPAERLKYQYDYIMNNHYKYNKELRDAVFEKNAEEKVNKAIEGMADINSLDSNGCTPLINAARNGQSLEVFKSLLKAGALVDAKCVEGLTALMFISTLAQGVDEAKAEIEKLALFKEYGADINLKDDGGNSALMYAIQSGADINYIISLLTMDADVNTVNLSGDTPLWLAIKKKLPLKVLEVLIEYGADINFKAPNGDVPYSYVAYVCDMLGHKRWLLPFLLTLVAGGTLRDSEAQMVSSSLLLLLCFPLPAEAGSSVYAPKHGGG